MMTGINEFANDGRTDVTRCSCDKNFHFIILLKGLKFSNNSSINYRVNSNASLFGRD